MNKTPEEIKEGIKKCLSGVDCFNNCPYAEFGIRDGGCGDTLREDVLQYIETLERKAADK